MGRVFVLPSLHCFLFHVSFKFMYEAYMHIEKKVSCCRGAYENETNLIYHDNNLFHDTSLLCRDEKFNGGRTEKKNQYYDPMFGDIIVDEFFRLSREKSLIIKLVFTFLPVFFLHMCVSLGEKLSS